MTTKNTTTTTQTAIEGTLDDSLWHAMLCLSDVGIHLVAADTEGLMKDIDDHELAAAELHELANLIERFGRENVKEAA